MSQSQTKKRSEKELGTVEGMGKRWERQRDRAHRRYGRDETVRNRPKKKRKGGQRRKEQGERKRGHRRREEERTIYQLMRSWITQFARALGWA